METRQEVASRQGGDLTESGVLNQFETVPSYGTAFFAFTSSGAFLAKGEARGILDKESSFVPDKVGTTEDFFCPAARPALREGQGSRAAGQKKERELYALLKFNMWRARARTSTVGR